MSDLPLQGLKVLVMRPEHQAEELAQRLRALGAEPLVVPAVRIVDPEDWGPIDAVLDRLDQFGWLVFTSVNGVESVFGRIRQTGRPRSRLAQRIAAIGPATAAALEMQGVQAHWMPPAFTTVSLGAELPGAGKSVCLVRAEAAGAGLDEALRGRGFEVERVNAYRTEPMPPEDLARAADLADAAAMTSASISRSFSAAVGADRANALQICSIGPETSRACRDEGIRVDLEAEVHTIAGLVSAMARHHW